MITEIINGMTRLTATDGLVLTNGVTSGTKVWLSPQDSADNWREVEDGVITTDPEAVITEMEGLL